MYNLLTTLATFGVDVQFPLTNPVLIFTLILFILLFAPILLNKIRIPHIIGLIIAGAAVGPNGFNLLERDSSIELFGMVGLLYIMFLAGLEIDLADFKKNSKKSIVFGLYTFIIPTLLGIFSGIYILNFSLKTSILLSSMFASHTLLAYPIVSKFGVIKNRAVNITIGGTLITDTLALLVLAAVVGTTSGEVGSEFWIKLIFFALLFGFVIMAIFPIIARWFFKRYHESSLQYIFVLGIVFLAGFLVEAAGIEAIIGAFLAGLALNRLIPSTSPLMNRIEFVGNALFIPFFLLGVGMLIDYNVFFKDYESIKVAIVMSVIATSAKYIAAWLTQKSFRFTKAERSIIFGLSNAQAAATLAVVLVGYNVIIGYSESGEAIRLLNESILNGTILMILVTCTISTFVTQKGARVLALEEESQSSQESTSIKERILIPINSLDSVEELVNLGVIIKSSKNRKWLYALNIIDDNQASDNNDRKARKLLEKASSTAAASDNYIHELMRYDTNPITGIKNVIKENKITDLILGLHIKKDISSTFLGRFAEGVINECCTTTIIYKSLQPLATIKRHIVVVPSGAERESGFAIWLMRVWNIGRNTGSEIHFYSNENTLSYIKEVQKKFPISAVFNPDFNFDDFLIISRELKEDDNLIIVMSRSNGESYNKKMEKIPDYLDRYFKNNTFMLIYPIQDFISIEGEFEFNNINTNHPIQSFDDFTKGISSLFKRR